MDSFWKSNSSTMPPPVPATNAGGYPSDGSPLTGTPSTVPGAWWYHMLSEELTNALVALGGVPDYTQTNQLGAAMLAAIAAAKFSGNYADLTNKPVFAPVAMSGSFGDLTNIPAFAAVAMSGNYNDLTNKPALAVVATSGNYSDLSGLPALAPVATTGSYADLTNKPALATVATTGSYSDLLGLPVLAAVATSGSYSDLNNKPALATVATTGSYNDLLNLPTGFPSNLPGITIELGHSAQANGGRGIDQGSYYQLDMSIGSDTFNGLAVTFNADKTMNLPGGTYLIAGSALLTNGGVTDTYQVPIQMVLSAGYTGYGFPGIYQYSTRVFPGPVTGTMSLSGGFGSIGISGTGPGVSPMAVMFSKIAGSVSGITLSLQGYITFLKIG